MEIILGIIIILLILSALGAILKLIAGLVVVILCICGAILGISLVFFVVQITITYIPIEVAKMYLFLLIPITIVWCIYKLYEQNKIKKQKKIMIEDHYYIANTIVALLPDLGMATELDVYREIKERCTDTLRRTSVSKGYMEDCLKRMVQNSKAKVVLEIEKDTEVVGKILYQTLESSGMELNVASSMVIEMDE